MTPWMYAVLQESVLEMIKSRELVIKDAELGVDLWILFVLRG